MGEIYTAHCTSGELYPYNCPRIIDKIKAGDSYLEFELGDDNLVKLIDPPDKNLVGAVGKWGELRKRLRGFNPTGFTVELLGIGGDAWSCHYPSTKRVLDELLDKVSRRNRQIDDLRRDLSEAKRDKEYWKAVAKDHERTLLAQEANRS